MRLLMRFLITAALMVAVPGWLVLTETGLRVVMVITEKATDGAITVTAAHGSLLGPTHLSGFVYDDGTTRVQLPEATLQLRLSRLWVARVQVESLSADALDILVRDGDGPGSTEPLNVRTPIFLALKSARIGSVRLDVENTFAWSLKDVALRARWPRRVIEIEELRAETAEAGPIALQGKLVIEDDRLLLDGVRVSARGTIWADGAIALTPTASNDLRYRWDELRYPPESGAVDLQSANGEGTLVGPWPDYQWTVDGAVRYAQLPGTLKARGQGSYSGMVFQRAELTALDGVTTGNGRLDWSGPLLMEGQLRFRDINPKALNAQWPGRLTGTADLLLRWAESKPLLKFNTALNDSQLRGYPLALRASGSTDGPAVHLDAFALDSGPTQLRARGRLWPTFALDGSMNSPDLASVWPSLRGQAEMQAQLRGAPDQVHLVASGEAKNLRWQDYQVQILKLDMDWQQSGSSEMKLEAQGLQALDQWMASLRAELSGTPKRHRLMATAQHADGELQLTMDGGEQRERWLGQLQSMAFQPTHDRRWALESPVELEWQQGRFSAGNLCMSGADSRLCATGSGDAHAQSLSLDLDALALSRLRPWLPSDWQLEGSVKGTASVEFVDGELTRMEADLQSSPGKLSAAGSELTFGVGHLKVAPQERALVAVMHLTPSGGTVEGELRFGPGKIFADRSLRGTLNTSLPDLSWLPVLSPEIASADGSLESALTISGSLRDPALQGAVNVREGRLRLTTPGVELTEFTAEVKSRADIPLGLRLQAQSGGGPLVLAGEILEFRPTLRGQFTLTGTEAQWFNTPEARAWVTPDLSLNIAEGQMRLSGELTVVRADITPSELEGGGVAPSSDQVLVREAEANEQQRLPLTSEVRIVLGDKVRFDGLGLKTRLEGGLTAFDEPGRPTRARGELRLVGGRYKAYGQDLQIETGRLLFSGGSILDPTIDLRASRSPREDIRVGLRARGTLDAPSFSLYSEPTMTQEEQLSWLVLGRSLSESLQGGGQGELAGAAASLGLLGGDYLAQQVGTRIGLDEVSVGARPGETAEKARFTIGKYLSPKLFVSYGVALFEPGQFLNLQYDLGRGFKLSGESGATQSGDLLYTIER